MIHKVVREILSAEDLQECNSLLLDILAHKPSIINGDEMVDLKNKDLVR